MSEKLSDHDIKAKTAHALFMQGKHQEAFTLYSEILRVDANHSLSLLGYAEEMFRRQQFRETLDVTLRVLIVFGTGIEDTEESKRAGLLFAKLISKPGIINQILAFLKPSLESAEALDFLARISLSFGEVVGSVQLMQAAAKINPEEVKYINNLIDALEIVFQYDKAFTLAKYYLKTQSHRSVGGVLASDVLKSLEEKSVMTSKTYVQTGEDTPDIAQTDSLYSEDELKLLSLYFKIVKLLYVSGDIETAEAVFKTVKPARDNGGGLHFTLIRNDSSYYGYIETLLQNPIDLPEKNRLEQEKKLIYVIGDSHILSSAWRSIENEKAGKRLFKPFLINGCKIWHLRKESHAFPKVAFYQALKQLPKHAEVLLVLGEVDCREGVLVALQKGRYQQSLEEAFKVLVDIYIDMMQQIAAKYRIAKLYIQPAPPVLNETRPIISIFNRHLAARLIELKQKEPNSALQWIHIESEVLTLGKDSLLDEMKLDGSHLHPHYVSLIQNALNTINTYG
jgi:tetratricopeptide (TPR) repeat protein